MVGYWAHETLLDTDKFMAAVTPAVESDAVKQVVADRLSDQVLEALDLDTRVADALDAAGDRMSEAIANALDLSPAQAARLQRLGGGLQLLAGSIAGGLETRIREAITTFVTSREGDGLLVDLVRNLHERTVLLLRDELDQLPSIDVESGEVKLNLVPMVAESIRRVVNAGIVAIGGERQIPEFASGEDAEQAIDRLAGIVGRDLPPDFGQVPLMSEDQLRNAQGLVQTFDRVVWVLIGLAILLSVAGCPAGAVVDRRPAAGRRGRRSGRAGWLVRGASDHRCRRSGCAHARRTEGGGRHHRRGGPLTPAVGHSPHRGGPAGRPRCLRL